MAFFAHVTKTLPVSRSSTKVGFKLRMTRLRAFHFHGQNVPVTHQHRHMITVQVKCFDHPLKAIQNLPNGTLNGGLTSIHKAPFSFAEARLLNSHGEAFVYPTRNITSLASEPHSIPGLELKERDITIANLAEIPGSAAAVCVTHSNLPSRGEASFTAKCYRVC